MKNILPVSIIKMSGAGNTFALVDATKNSSWIDIEKSSDIFRSEFARKICDKVTGIAADGLLFIQSGSEGFDFDWDFYNSDGSTAEMCGNAARCAALFCSEYIAGNLKEIKFKTGAGLVTVQILSDKIVRVRMPEARFLKNIIALKTIQGTEENFALVNTGVPHLVKNIVSMAETNKLKELAREFRSHNDLKPDGANVTFYVENFAGKINAVTYERGVEDYTLACGTGAVAAALVYSKDSQSKEVEVQMPGGLLQVQFIEGDAHPIMTGEAVFIGEFKYNLEVIK